MRGMLVLRSAAVAAALLTASLISFPSFPNPAAGWLTSNPAISVNRALKGDRLPLLPAAQPHGLGSPLSPAQSQPQEKPPVGCDGAFSPISSPRLANIFRRCLV